MKKIGLIVLLLASAGRISATDILVKIYADKSIKSASLTCVLGSYRMSDEGGNEILQLQKGETLYLQSESEGVRIVKNDSILGIFSSLTLVGDGLKTMFKLSPEENDVEERIYDDHLEITVENQALRFINIVDLENYVAGVIQSEVLGSSDDVEFFKIQAIISRTYAMNNHNKHKKDGYNLCDGVHCQVYRSRNNTPKILQAAVETSGLVLVDENRKMISAAFHSNSGGQTINSEDVWSTPTSYLKSVIDTFSFDMRNSTWRKEYGVSEWLNMLQRRYKYNINDSAKRDSALNFLQDTRLTHFAGDIPLKNMRKDLGLKSTFFSVRQEGDKVILDGRGYGHGVGLSQEGAIRMIREGNNVENVLKFYYKNVEIVHVDDLFSGAED